MAEQEQVPTNAQGGGEQPESGNARTFTQAELDRILADRLSREREKYSDYDSLRERASKWAEHEEAQKTELQRAQEAREQAEKAAQAAQIAANERLMRAAFLAEAAKAGAAHPEDAYALASKAGLEIAEDGTVPGVAEAVAGLVEAGRLVMSGRPQAPSTNAGAGGGQRPSDKELALTPEEEATAKAMGIPLEEYAKYKPKT